MKRAVITGASRGIGKATAAEFLEHGWQVLGTSTSGQDWARENLSWIALDLFDPKSIKNAAKNVASHGPIDVLIDNAGIMGTGQSEERSAIDIPDLRKILEVNLIGTIDFTEQSLSAVNTGGHIVLLGSGLGSLSGANGAFAPSYSISKAALSMYTRKLAARLADREITVSIVSPGWVKTDMGGESAPRKPKEVAGEIFRLATSKVPSGLFWHQGKPIAW